MGRYTCVGRYYSALVAKLATGRYIYVGCYNQGGVILQRLRYVFSHAINARHNGSDSHRVLFQEIQLRSSVFIWGHAEISHFFINHARSVEGLHFSGDFSFYG